MTDAPGPLAASPAEKPVWYKRRAVLITLVLAVVLVVTVLTDLPAPTSRGADISSERSVMGQLNTDLAPCAQAVHEAVGIWTQQMAHALSASDEAQAPGILRDDQTACSFTDQSMFDLSNVEVPGSAAGKDMGNLVATATLWATSDALTAIEAVQTLMVTPGNAAAQRALAKSERALAKDRQAGLDELGAANRTLDTHLARPDMPALPLPAS